MTPQVTSQAPVPVFVEYLDAQGNRLCAEPEQINDASFLALVCYRTCELEGRQFALERVAVVEGGDQMICFKEVAAQ